MPKIHQTWRQFLIPTPPKRKANFLSRPASTWVPCIQPRHEIGLVQLTNAVLKIVTRGAGLTGCVLDIAHYRGAIIPTPLWFVYFNYKRCT